ncbi:FecR family protein [Parabacteroides bouchesdurhonensis]|uniref:FecR family protein n=1 Tax=Parabacteroides bouchesdurhonensis TaxID=1936995 RepID=UPI000C85CAFA|nr:FecR domain-containing protein [Parabacteroides bouchesdurhonensis]RHJ94034.1 DUF4974 domain-containing protein [Bacteroides sp. AM07-16]
MPKDRQSKKQQFRNAINRIVPLFKRYETETFGKDESDSWDVVSQRINAYERHHFRRRVLYFASAAACILILIIGGLFVSFPVEQPQKTTLADIVTQLPVPTPSTQEIMLVTSNKQKLNIEDNTDVKYNPDGSVVVNSETVDQTVTKEKKKETDPVYNQIFVPKGRRTNITFADGTRIYVNSGTRVVYPAIFADDKREIYVEGEIYLEVKRDEARPFYVKTENMNVRVLGTVFNVCAYKEDEEASVVLVSGKVEVETHKNEKVTLSPDELFSIQPEGISTRKVDASEYVCWTQNMMIFKQEPLNKVLTKLSRYYGEKIAWNADLSKMTISGKLDLRDNLEDVMKIITTATPVTFASTDSTIQVKLKK